MTYHATVELTSEIQMALQASALTFNRGQWVSLHGKKGRFISNRSGVITVLWRYLGESFTHYNLRFKRACLTRRAGRKRFAYSSPFQRDAFSSDFDKLPQWVDDETLDEMLLDPDRFEFVTVCGALVEGYQLLMRCRSALLMQSLITGRKRIVKSGNAHEFAIFGRSHYQRYPKGWEAVCH